ncbi:MAG: hypothetical protein O7F12_17670, partial [Nitrospirae bacterium]|nr:hypothetical protein [Nitrospirota bacterium]
HLLGVEISSHSMQQLHHSFRSFPFEDSLLKSQIPKMVFVTDSSNEPLLRFGFQDLCSELLSAKTRSAKIKDGFRKLKKRYVAYGQVRAQQHHHSVTSYLLIYYPLYLLKKTFLSLAGKSSSSKPTSGH